MSGKKAAAKKTKSVHEKNGDIIAKTLYKTILVHREVAFKIAEETGDADRIDKLIPGAERLDEPRGADDKVLRTVKKKVKKYFNSDNNPIDKAAYTIAEKSGDKTYRVVEEEESKPVPKYIAVTSECKFYLAAITAVYSEDVINCATKCGSKAKIADLYKESIAGPTHMFAAVYKIVENAKGYKKLLVKDHENLSGDISKIFGSVMKLDEDILSEVSKVFSMFIRILSYVVATFLVIKKPKLGYQIMEAGIHALSLFMSDEFDFRDSMFNAIYAKYNEIKPPAKAKKAPVGRAKTKQPKEKLVGDEDETDKAAEVIDHTSTQEVSEEEE